MGKMKYILAELLSVLGISWVLFAVQKRFYAPFIRVVNYHGTPLSFASQFELHLEYYRKHYEPVNEALLKRFLEEGVWTSSKPGIVITFDDGIENNYKVARPLLEKFDFVGWFFIPTNFCKHTKEKQIRFAEDNRFIKAAGGSTEARAISESHLRLLSKNHVVGCHTANHRRFQGTISDEVLENEIVSAKQNLEEIIGRSVDCFAWVGGEEQSYNAQAQKYIEKAYLMSFLTNSRSIQRGTNPYFIERTNIECHFSLSLVKLQLSGILDFMYWPKRMRVKQLLASDS